MENKRMITSLKKVFVVFGPTASGKSDFALCLANHQNGEIINADSMQIYNALPLLTSQPNEKDKAITNHHLYSFFEIHEKSSVALWLQHANSKIAEIIKKNKTPIIVGGTGLYISALLDGIDHIPPISEAIKNEAKKKLNELNVLDFYEELLQLDPNIKGVISKYDSQRILRAYEVIKETGISIKDWWKTQHRKPSNYNFFKFFLNPPRNDLYKSCNERFVEMLNYGIVDEVVALCKNEPNLKDYQIYKAIGVREILSMIEHKSSINDMITLSQQNTRNYAKRQITWFKNQINSDLIIDSINKKSKEETLIQYLNKLV